jgi:hypothetical protein
MPPIRMSASTIQGQTGVEVVSAGTGEAAFDGAGVPEVEPPVFVGEEVELEEVEVELEEVEVDVAVEVFVCVLAVEDEEDDVDVGVLVDVAALAGGSL